MEILRFNYGNIKTSSKPDKIAGFAVLPTVLPFAKNAFFKGFSASRYTKNVFNRVDTST